MHLYNAVIPVVMMIVLQLVEAQQGLIPARITIPGAIATNFRAQYRNEKPVRIRRPQALRSQDFSAPIAAQRNIDDLKPVTEAVAEDAADVLLPQLLRDQQLAQAQQAQFQQTVAQFLNAEPNALPAEVPTLINEDTIFQSSPAVTRFTERPQPTINTNTKLQLPDFGIGSQRFNVDRPQVLPSVQPSRPNVIRSRPSVREPRPQFEPQTVTERVAAPVARPRPKPIQSRPIEHNVVSEDRDVPHKRQRPVAQTLRKWREENEDGSITWGYENDDGSFKEEIIGTDCITKGTYGYIDPDGNKREYHYETGIKCDPNNRQTEEDQQHPNGFINYEENKAVLPNGIEIDMSQLGKKKSKRPGATLRDQPVQIPQNQYYRN